MKHIKLFESMNDEMQELQKVSYTIITDDAGLTEDPGDNSLKMYTLVANSEEEAMGFISQALGGPSEGPFMDRHDLKQLNSVAEFVQELDGMNGTWQLYGSSGENAPIGMHEVRPLS